MNSLATAIYLTVITANTQWHTPDVKQYLMPNVATCIEVLKETKQNNKIVEDADGVDHLIIVTITCGGEEK